MIGKIYITDTIGEDTTLLDVVRQVKSQKDATEFIAIIDSNGGYVDDGFEIYDYLKNLKTPVHTYAKKAYSIASVIFMAGERRLVDQDASAVLMIHLPWLQIFSAGNYGELVGELEVLKQAEDRLVNFYSKEIGIASDTVHALLSKETYLNSKESVELGFATETKAIAVAMALLKKEHNKKEDKSLMNLFNKKLDSILKTLGVKAELILQDVNGVEIIFPELSAADEPAVDDKAKVDGKDAEGEYLMPDGKKFQFAMGSLTQVDLPSDDEVPAEDTEEVADADESADADELPTEESPTEEESTDVDALKKENEELKAKVAQLEAKLSEYGEADTQDKLLDILTATTAKLVDMENKYQALAKSIGSTYEPTVPKNVASATVVADENEHPTFSIKRKSIKK